MSNPIVDLLFKMGAIKFSLDQNQPFRYSSGLQGPIYCDNRIILAHPVQRRQVTQALHQLMGDWRPQAIMAMATGGIPHGAWLAQHLSLPFGYLRTQAKSHGRGKQIEGFAQKGASVVILEDLINQGQALSQTMEGLGDYFNVLGILSIVNYETPAAKSWFAQQGLSLRSLVVFDDLLATAQEAGLIDSAGKALLQRWQQNPQDWQAKA